MAELYDRPSASRRVAGRIKGAAFAEFVHWFGKRETERLARVVSDVAHRYGELDPRAAGYGIIASRWYSAETVHALLDGLVRGLDVEQRRALAFDGASVVMSATLRGVYRLLFGLMATPERYAKHAPRLWSFYYDSGEFRVSVEKGGRAVAAVRRWSSHHPFICELNWGAASAIYRAMGCRQVKTERVSCVDEGTALECRFETTWEP